MMRADGKKEVETRTGLAGLQGKEAGKAKVTR